MAAVDVERFITTFNRKFGVSHPAFYHGTYQQALAASKEHGRYMLVYLHRGDMPSTRFCRKVICSQSFNQFARSRNSQMWACSLKSPEGKLAQSKLGISSFPHLTLLDRDNFVVAHIRGASFAPRVVVQILEEKIRLHEGPLKAVRMLEKKKAEMESLVPPEPWIGDPDAICIQLMTPRGVKIRRRFLKTHSLKFLYYYVFCHKCFPDTFSIVSVFPSRLLPCKPREGEYVLDPPSFKDVGINGDVTLFVQEKGSDKNPAQNMLEYFFAMLSIGSSLVGKNQRRPL